MSGDRAWATALRAACERPAETAAGWRAGGGKVVGLLGWSAPRELVMAAGMLPVRLSPDRLAGPGPWQEGGGAHGPRETGEPDDAGRAGRAGEPAWRDAAAAFGRELTPGTAALAVALLSGALNWIDFLLIGRDREDYTRLFYLLRELRRGGTAPGLPPVAFFDLLRLPSRTSARYNRQQAAELTAVIAGWSGRPVTPAGLADAVEAARVTALSLRGIQELRTRPEPAIVGADALAAAIAARVLPAAELPPLLDAALAAGAPDVPRLDAAAREATAPDATVTLPVVRVFLAGSGTDDLTAYQALEDLGLAIVGEDHEWGDDGSEYPRATRDPLDGIVDRYHLAHGAAARAGLRDRVGRTAERVRAAGPDGVLYLLGPHDDAAGWELPALREHLGGIPLIPVRLKGAAGDGGRPELREAGRRLLAGLGAAGTDRGPAEARHG